MEELPAEYIGHGLPLVFLSGLSHVDAPTSQTSGRQESGTRISAESSICSAERAATLSKRFADWNGISQPWNALALPGPTGQLKYRFRSVGRSYTLPPRKAAPQAQSPTSEQFPVRQNNELHSPLSPLSPGSPIHPDGIMTPLWFSKHQSQVPCLVFAFFDFTADGAAKDETIKADIIAAKSALSRSGFRTRFAAVLMSDKSIVQSSELDERFSSVRRATSLDAKTGLFFMPPMPTASEVATFVQALLTTLQPACVEYYRELTKHARRKKSRSTVPLSPTVATHAAAQSLSTPGWNARYELKQGVFAEARQEMDVAERHYSQAIEELCSPEGVFESMPSWSPRWDETRLICDSTAVRVVRCHLWNGYTTTASQFWHEYRARMKSLIDRKGKGTHTYGWLAWETRWARIMAQLVQLAELPMLDGAPRSKNDPPQDIIDYVAYSRPDRAFQSIDGIPPTFMLHHPGYWHRLALGFARARYASAIAIPDEDRLPPGQSPASSVANRAQSYDMYLVPEPHEEYANAESAGLVENMQIAQLTEQANQEFANKGQQRMIQLLSLELARDLIQSQHLEVAYEVLLPLWQSCTWRHERWHDLFHDVIGRLLQCAIAVKDKKTVLGLLWEHMALPPRGLDKAIEIEPALTGLSGEDVSLEFKDADRLSPFEVRFAFDESTAYASEQLSCQLTIRSTARPDAAPVSISQVSVTFSDKQVVTFTDDGATTEDSILFKQITLDDDAAKTAQFTLKPSQTTVLQFGVTFQESGPANIEKITLLVEAEHYTVQHAIQDASLLQSAAIYSKQDGIVHSHETRYEDTTSVEVQPKPPKVNIRLLRLQKHYYTGEQIKLGIELVNEEVHGVSGDITLSVTADDTAVPSSLRKADSVDTYDGTLESLASGATHTGDMLIEAPQETALLSLSLTFTYKLDGGSQSILIKTFATTIQLAALLQPKWAFGPLLHPEPWPSYFESGALIAGRPAGLPQRWRASFTGALPTDAVTIRKISLQPDKQLADAALDISASITDDSDNKIAASFELTTTKNAAEDRRPIQLQLVCVVEWSRKDDSTVQTAVIAVPKIVLPTSEPRVLCTVSKGKDTAADAVVTYHLENPSTHFLTFSLTMDPSDDFAFSGVKYRTLSLVPMSRVAVPYQIMLHGGDTEGRWIWPNMQVTDSYYQKTLRIQPAGPDVKLDSQNSIGVFVG